MKNPVKLDKKLKNVLSVIISMAFWIGVWWTIAATLKKPLILPTPLAVAKKLSELALTFPFWKSVFSSLLGISIGIFFALIVGVLLAILTTKSKLLHAICSPFLALAKATPVASVIFLVLLWIGRSRVSIFIAFLMALPIVWGNVREGIGKTDSQLLEMASVFHLSLYKRLRFIHIPSVLPYFLAACRSAVSLAWKAGIAAEVLCVPQNSIGRAIYESKQYLFTEDLFAWTLTVILISVAIEQGTLLLFGLAKRHERSARNAEAQ